MTPAGPDISASRHQARERALGLLYEAELKTLEAAEVVAALPVEPDAYTVTLVTGVHDRLAEVDQRLGAFSKGWSVARMAAVERAILRIAAYELLACPDVPTGVVISEAVELAQQYSTAEAARFVNGLIAALAQDCRPDPAP